MSPLAPNSTTAEVGAEALARLAHAFDVQRQALNQSFEHVRELLLDRADCLIDLSRVDFEVDAAGLTVHVCSPKISDAALALCAAFRAGEIYLRIVNVQLGHCAGSLVGVGNPPQGTESPASPTAGGAGAQDGAF